MEPSKPQRIAMVLQLKPDAMPAYQQEHDQQWPEVRHALHQVGLRHLALWYDPVRNQVFYHAEYHGDEPFHVAMKRYAQFPRVQEWEALMHHYQEVTPDRHGVADGVYWVPLQPIFYQE